jgi:hypothetical protein
MHPDSRKGVEPHAGVRVPRELYGNDCEANMEGSTSATATAARAQP